MTRFRFDFDTIPPISWFPGHMATTLKQMREKISKKIDYVIEVRDARVPLSCINPVFDELFESKKKIIVYNKIDLTGTCLSSHLTFPDAINLLGMVSISAKEKDSKSQRKSADSILHFIEERYPHTNILPHTFKLKGLVVGMPNVGKSTLINTLRSVGIGRHIKAAPVGKLPGFTKSISGEIKILQYPPFYIMDSPGIMVPRIADKETALKMALTSAIKETIIGEIRIVDYLLFRMNLLSKNPLYVKYFNMDTPTDDINVFLEAVAKRLGLLKAGSILDLQQAAVKVIRLYNEGFFGSFCLDELY